MIYILFNPLANNGAGEKSARAYLEGNVEANAEFKDVTKVEDMSAFVSSLTADDKIILAGGDGTINKFINAIGEEPVCEIEYIPTGSGNDFKHDIGEDVKTIKLNDYIKDLPSVTVNGKSYKFINGVGFGLDGYCCEKGDEMKSKSDKPVNYTGIAIKGLMGDYKPRNATVTVDGEEKSFTKVWIAPTMKGRYYGGGMMVTPAQDRLATDGKVTLAVWHGTGKLTTLMRFPKIFKGEHVKYTKMIEFFTGSEITVKFDKPTALQIDGETIVGVTEYTVNA